MMNHCPGCGADTIRFDGIKKFTCPACGWIYYHNVATAVMAALTIGDEVLFARRARDPARGLLELPGGFVDPDETAEAAIARELREELGLDGLCFEYVGSASNTYPFGGVTYKTCDLIYTASLERVPEIHAPEEIAALVLARPADVAPEDVAFSSVRRALELLHARRQ